MNRHQRRIDEAKRRKERREALPQLQNIVREAKANDGQQAHVVVAGWSFILSVNEIGRDEDVERVEALMRERGMKPPPPRPRLDGDYHAPDGSNWWRFSAMLVPAGRGSDDEDWHFLGFATAQVGASPDALVTPLESTPPNAVHHWTWTDSGYDVLTSTRNAIALIHPDRKHTGN